MKNTVFYAKKFEELSIYELYEMMFARSEVFVAEEKILYPDADGVDLNSVHVFSKNENNKMTSYLRMFPKADEENIWQIGRVLTRDRGNGLGREIMEYAMKVAKDKFESKGIYVESQKHAEGFYRKLGFETVSEDFIEAGILHVKMRIQF